MKVQNMKAEQALCTTILGGFFLSACPLTDCLKSSSCSQLVWEGSFVSHCSKVNLWYSCGKSQYREYRACYLPSTRRVGKNSVYSRTFPHFWI